MYRKKVRRWISILFVILFLASCICLEPVQTDALMLASDATNTPVHTLTCGTLSAGSDLCTVEMLGNHASAVLYRQTVLRSHLSEKVEPTVSVIGLIAIHPLTVPHFTKIQQNIYSSAPHGMRLIRMVHKMDGKKRPVL